MFGHGANVLTRHRLYKVTYSLMHQIRKFCSYNVKPHPRKSSSSEEDPAVRIIFLETIVDGSQNKVECSIWSTMLHLPSTERYCIYKWSFFKLG